MQLQSAGNKPEAVGVEGLKATIWRQLNKRTLPNLMPGENYFQLSADRLAPGYLLRVEVNFERDGKPDKQIYVTRARSIPPPGSSASCRCARKTTCRWRTSRRRRTTFMPCAGS